MYNFTTQTQKTLSAWLLTFMRPSEVFENSSMNFSPVRRFLSLDLRLLIPSQRNPGRPRSVLNDGRASQLAWTAAEPWPMRGENTREWADSVTIYFLVFGWTSLFSISRVPPLSFLCSVLQPCKPCERLYTWFTFRHVTKWLCFSCISRFCVVEFLLSSPRNKRVIFPQVNRGHWCGYNS